MPEAFLRCVREGGRVITKTIDNEHYMHICYKKGVAYPGEVMKKEAVENAADNTFIARTLDELKTLLEDESPPSLLISDIDGVIIDNSKAQEQVPYEKRPPFRKGVSILQNFFQAHGTDGIAILVTGRPESTRYQTLTQINALFPQKCFNLSIFYPDSKLYDGYIAWKINTYNQILDYFPNTITTLVEDTQIILDSINRPTLVKINPQTSSDILTLNS